MAERRGKWYREQTTLHWPDDSLPNKIKKRELRTRRKPTENLAKNAIFEPKIINVDQTSRITIIKSCVARKRTNLTQMDQHLIKLNNYYCL